MSLSRARLLRTALRVLAKRDKFAESLHAHTADVKGFMEAFGITTEERKVFWLPKKRCRFSDEPVAVKQPAGEHE